MTPQKTTWPLWVSRIRKAKGRSRKTSFFSRSTGMAAVASITSEMFLVDVLYMSLLQKDFEQHEEMLVNTSRVVNLLRE